MMSSSENKLQTAAQKRRLRRLLSRAEKDPASVLRDPRCLKPKFCRAYFDLCDSLALEAPRAAMTHATHAFKLARKTGDPHLVNASRGVLAHAYIARQAWREAWMVLDSAEDEACACCTACRVDWRRRTSDLLLETRDLARAKAQLKAARDEVGEDPDVEVLCQIRFLRGMLYHFQYRSKKAIHDVGRILEELPLDSPRGYFFDSVAFLVCFLKNASRSEFSQARRYLKRFKRRIRGRKDFSPVRTRLAWAEGIVFGRLDDPRRAADRLESARRALRKTGPDKQVLGVSTDLAQLYCRGDNEHRLQAIRRLLTTCERELELRPEPRRLLGVALRSLDAPPEQIFDALVALRASFRVPLPGLLDALRPSTAAEDEAAIMDHARANRPVPLSALVPGGAASGRAARTRYVFNRRRRPRRG